MYAFQRFYYFYRFINFVFSHQEVKTVFVRQLASWIKQISLKSDSEDIVILAA